MKTLVINQNGFNANVNGNDVAVEFDLQVNPIASNINTADFFVRADDNSIKFISNEKMHNFLEQYSKALEQSGEIDNDDLKVVEIEGKKYAVNLESIVLFDNVYITDQDGNQIAYFDPSDECNGVVLADDCKAQAGLGDLDMFIQRLNYAYLDIKTLLAQNGVKFQVI